VASSTTALEHAYTLAVALLYAPTLDADAGPRYRLQRDAGILHVSMGMLERRSIKREQRAAVLLELASAYGGQ
jgi:hypothetical protein